MKFIEEFRDAKLVKGLLAEITRLADRPFVMMEICGGQTHSIVRSGLDQLRAAVWTSSCPNRSSLCTAPAVRSASRRRPRSTKPWPSRAGPR
jgi:hydrogenase expression/formation protein HypD